MKRWILSTGIAVLTATPGIAAAAINLDGVTAKPPTPAHARAYERAYAQVVHRLGAGAPGRNIIRSGVADHVPATDSETLASLTVLRRMLGSPSPSAQVASAGAPAATAPSAPTASSGAGVPACASESGTNYSTGPSNTNASSGATGRYQITPSTAAAYGCNLTTASGQDACAQAIYARQGASAWVGCGG